MKRFMILLLIAACAWAAAAEEAPNYAEYELEAFAAKKEELVAQNEQVFVLYHNYTLPSKRLAKMVEAIKQQAEDRHYNTTLFAVVNASLPQSNSSRKLPYLEYRFKDFAEVLQRPHGMDRIENFVERWTLTKPVRERRFSDIDKTERHLFVLASERTLASQKTNLFLLTKFLHPIGVFYGFSHLPKLGDVSEAIKDHPVVYIGHNSTLVPIDFESDLHKQVEAIKAYDFPTQHECNDQLAQALLHTNQIVFLYQEKPADDSNVQVMVDLFKEKNLHFHILVFKGTEYQDTCKFLQTFTDLNEAGVRAMISQPRLKKYRMKGEFAPKEFDEFVDQFVAGTLKPFRLDEEIKAAGDEKIASIGRGGLKKLQKTKQKTELVYIYSESLHQQEKDLKELLELKTLTRNAKDFQISLLNYDKNDISDKMILKFPVVYVVNDGDTYVMKKKFNLKNLMLFVSDVDKGIVYEDPEQPNSDL